MVALIEAHNITKAFPGTLALNQIEFELLPGEIHALVGENGAGKSTLMLIMAGVYPSDAGELIVEGRPVRLRDPHHAQRLGISTVFQELALAPNMSVAENVFTNAQPVNRAGLIRFEEMFSATERALAVFGIKVNPRAPLRRYSVAVQQIIEIARAIQRQARVLILDEPTSAIGESEIDRLLQVLRILRDRGVGIIYVSHKLDEVFTISDRITVLKDGKLVGTVRTADTTQEAVVHMMVGRELDQLFPPRNGGREDTVLKVRNLCGPGYANVSLDIHSGTVLGVFGLTGAGRTELARGIFGIEPITAGEILIRGRPVKITDPRKAMSEGIAYIPEDRKQDGLFLEMSLLDNVAAACLRVLSGSVFIHNAKGVALARDAVARLMIKARGVEQRVSSLSGGNQQKVLFAKWLARHPKVLIADEPTRGTDVGAKAEIHTLLRRLAQEGAAVVMISSELPEVLGMSDRVAVMREGRLVAVLDRDQATEERVASYALGANCDDVTAHGRIDNE